MERNYALISLVCVIYSVLKVEGDNFVAFFHGKRITGAPNAKLLAELFKHSGQVLKT